MMISLYFSIFAPFYVIYYLFSRFNFILKSKQSNKHLNHSGEFYFEIITSEYGGPIHDIIILIQL